MSDGSPAAEVRFEAGAFGQLQKPRTRGKPVISGEFEFTLGGDTRVVRAGEPDIAGQRRQRLLLPERRRAAGNSPTR